jgi:hypothetical protein
VAGPTPVPRVCAPFLTAMRLLLLMLAAASPAAAGELSLSGQLRARVEVIDGQVRPGFAGDDVILAIRSTVRADYADGPVTLSAELRDARVHGTGPDSAVSSGDINVLDLVVLQARADLGDALGPGSRTVLTAGRMMLGIGSQRLVDPPDFRNATNSFTGVKVETGAGDWQVELAWAMPVLRLPDDRAEVLSNRWELDREGLDRQVWGAHAMRGNVLGPVGLGLTYVGYHERDRPGRPTRNRNLHTVGPWLFAPPRTGRLDLDAEAYVQWGSIRETVADDAPVQDVLAGFARVEIGYSFAGAWAPRVSFRYDWASGDRPGDRFTRFDRLFGNRVADFAVSGQYAAIGRANISSPGLRLGVGRGPTDGYVTARLLWADSATDSFSTTGVRDPTGASGRYAGAQVEGRVRHWLKRDRLRLDTAFAILFRGGLLVHAPNAPPGRTLLYMAPALVLSF